MPLDFDPYPNFDTVPSTADKLEALAIEVAKNAIPELRSQNPNVNWNEILDLVSEEHEIIELEGKESFEARFQQPNGDIDSDKLAAYERLALVKNTVRSYAPVMNERAHNTDTGGTADLLRENVRQMKALGFSYKDTVKFFDQDAKESKSPTPHPTEGLSINGVKRACELVDASESDIRSRQTNIEQAIHNMVVDEDVGASHKFTIMDEAELSDFFAKNHNAGISQLERTIEEAIEAEYGQRPQITLDAALRSWDYDSDGKNNADGFAFMAKASRTTLGAFNQIIEAIEGMDGPITDDLNELYVNTVKLRDELQPVYQRSAEIVQKLAAIQEPADRAAYYREAYAEYPDMQSRFGQIYEAVGSKNRGLDFYKKALQVLDDAVETAGPANQDSVLELDDALRLLRRTGLALEKGQPRQNDFEHIQIVNNLFNHENFRKRGFFRSDELQEIDQAGGYKELSHERQQKFLGVLTSHIAENGNRKEILADLYEANPLEFAKNGNGYPIQTRTLLDRLALRQLYQLKFDQGIISDAQPGSDDRMHFLFQAFGIKNGTSMSLHEDRGTLPRRSQLLEEFAKSAGDKALAKTRGFFSTVLKGTPLDKTSSKDTWSIIHPASDAERGGGFGTRMESSDIWRKIAKLSYQSGVTVAQMLGGGMHPNRFGGNPMILFNTVAEELKYQVKKDGKGRFDRRVQEDRHIMRSATSMLFTEQGRHKRYNMATPSQVSDDFARKLSRMIAVRFDLEGLVEDNTFIAENYQFENRAIRGRFDGLWKRAIDRYNSTRFAKGADGKIIIDKLAEKITTPHTIGFKNNGARPAAKGSGAKSMTGVRAIENAVRFDISQTHAGGFFGAGQMMQEIATDIRSWKSVFGSRISIGDVKDWLEHPEWEFHVHGKCLVDAGRYDPTYGLQQLDWQNATFDQLKEVGEQVRFVKVAGEDDVGIIYEGNYQDLSEEQLYFAKIWYDRLAYVSHMEAALNEPDPMFKGLLNRFMNRGEVSLLSTSETIMNKFRPDDNSPVFGLGEKTKERWPDVVTTLEEHDKNRPQLVIQHMRERQIAADMKNHISKSDAVERQGGEAQLRRSGATFRAGTVPHWVYWASKKRYGSMPKPAGFQIEQVMTPKARADVERLESSFVEKPAVAPA